MITWFRDLRVDFKLLNVKSDIFLAFQVPYVVDRCSGYCMTLFELHRFKQNGMGWDDVNESVRTGKDSE